MRWPQPVRSGTQTTVVLGAFMLATACFEAEANHRISQEGYSTPQRSVALTIDDLPAVRSGELETVREITLRLLDRFSHNDIQAAGFINEAKLAVAGEELERTELLEFWLEAGHDLGNHTYSHLWLYDTPLNLFEADIVRGEAVTSELLGKRGDRIRYFRHPRLNTGPDLDTKLKSERFLADRGYTIAPVTIDNDDYAYAIAYFNAFVAGDSALMHRLGQDYVTYMYDVFSFYETLSLTVLEREPAQVLLLHASRLNADHLDQLSAMLRRRGYEFVSLEKALQDPAYDYPDTYVGNKGLSWLMRWAITRGMDPGTHPPVPNWVLTAAWPERDSPGN